MKHYNFREIREHGSCVDYAEQILGVKIENNRCAAVWRGGERNSVAIDAEKWYDHVVNQGGGLIDLCAITKFGGTGATEIQQAQEFLGDWLRLKEVKLRKAPVSRNRYDDLIAEGFVEKARYDYVDLDGELIYSVYRLEHPTRKKEFVQGTPEHWGISGITPIPYNWPTIAASDWCVVVEGEKDVETLRKIGIPATTNSGGAKKWRSEFAKYLKGKKVVILPDNDEVGQEHAKIVAKDLYGFVAGIKIVNCSKLPKGDVTDYFEQEGGDWNELAALIKDTPEYEPYELTAVESAKEANKKPFRNYIVEEKEIGNRKLKDKLPRQINDLVNDLHTRLLDAPYKVGEQMFDQDKNTGKINYIYDTSGLFSWIARKTNCVIDWARIDGCVTKSEFYEALRSEAKEYSAISFVPDYPARDDVFYLHPQLPTPCDDHAAFWRLVDFFCPEDDINRSLLATFMVAPIFYSPMVNRPLWIIDSPNGQGSGKSKLPEMVALLYGENFIEGRPIDVSLYDLERNYSEVVKRIISTKGRNSRILRLDNVTGILRSPNLATLVTTGSITGRASYGRGEESRPNNLTYVVTVNGATVDTDIASRAYYIMVKKPKMNPTWEDDIIAYITDYRMQIFADIIDIIAGHHPFDIQPLTRMPKFESQVLQPVCGTPEQYQQVVDFLLSKKEETNTDEELAQRIEEEIEIQLMSVLTIMGKPVFNPKTDKIFIRADVLDEWLKNKSWIDKHPTSIIRNMAKTSMLPQVCPSITKWPHHATDQIKRRSGIMWNYNVNSKPRVVGIKNGEVVEIYAEQ